LKSQIDAALAKLATRWVDAARRRALPVIAACLLITVAAGVYAVLFLGINSDNVRLVAKDLPSRRNHEAFARLFPNLENALLVVVDGETPELARESANALSDALESDSQYFEDAYVPGGERFFEEKGLLYRSPDELDAFADQMARLQPILAALGQDASVANLASLVEMGLETTVADAGGASVRDQDWAVILDSVGKATVAVYAEFPLALSWEELLLSGSAVEVISRRVIVVHPQLDFGSFLAAGRAMAQIREHALTLGLEAERGVTVRITGNPALNYEEMIGLAWDLGLGGVACFLLVIMVLTRALRSLRLVVAAVGTLLIGLVWTAAFAAAAVGHLTLVSASFAILFIGLGVDFGIHLGMAYANERREGFDHAEGLRRAAGNVGGSLMICTLTTATGFYVFVPTDYLGVAELGLIAGTGMIIILGLTLTLFPALLTKGLQIDPTRDIRRQLHFRGGWWRVLDRRSHQVMISAGVLLLAGIALIPGARFDVNVVQMRDPTTESVQTFNDLLAQSGSMSPWYVNSVASDLEAAQEVAARMQELDSVSHTLTLADYVPVDQEEKLEVLEDIGFLMDTPPMVVDDDDVQSYDQQVAALRRLHDFLGQSEIANSRSELARSVRVLREKLATFLERVRSDAEPEEALERLDELLLSGLPDQLTRLDAAVNTDAIVLEELPEELVTRMIARDGRARVQIFPRYDLSNEAAFARFTDDVQSIDPLAAGVAVNLVGFGRATRSSFQQALISAILLISLLLLLLWRRVAPMLLVMSPLVLSSVLTVAAMVLLDIPFNFGNVIVIPLLLGIGVDSGIHLVHRAEQLRGGSGDLMESTTARAVFYSALTTTLSFGTLAFSSHRGMASLGVLLSIGMTLTVICNLIVLPALLRGFRGRITQA